MRRWKVGVIVTVLRMNQKGRCSWKRGPLSHCNGGERRSWASEHRGNFPLFLVYKVSEQWERSKMGEARARIRRVLCIIGWKVYVFIMKGYWILSGTLFAFLRCPCDFYPSFCNMVYHTNFHMLNHPCIPLVNPMWLWYMSLFICCWIHFANVLLRLFISIFIRDIGL